MIVAMQMKTILCESQHWSFNIMIEQTGIFIRYSHFVMRFYGCIHVVDLIVLF